MPGSISGSISEMDGSDASIDDGMISEEEFMEAIRGFDIGTYSGE